MLVGAARIEQDDALFCPLFLRGDAGGDGVARRDRSAEVQILAETHASQAWGADGKPLPSVKAGGHSNH